MKMYILIREFVPLGKAVLVSAHSSLACYLKFKEHLEMQQWLDTSFKKVVCVVNDAEFEKARLESDNVVLTESTLDNQEVSVAFCPRVEYPKMFKFLRLYGK